MVGAGQLGAGVEWLPVTTQVPHWGIEIVTCPRLAEALWAVFPLEGLMALPDSPI